MAKHGNIDVPNLQVMKLCQSLCSRNFVKEQFSWSWYYYTLTDEGIEYLRDYLSLPSDVVPKTMSKANRPIGRPSGFGGDRGGGDSRGPPREGGGDKWRREGGDRDGYRSKEGSGGFGGDRPGFRGGLGRGGGAARPE